MSPFPSLALFRPHRLSLALATAFVRPRKLLILDEPEQRLDTEGIAWLSGRLREERDKGLAIVFASHEPTLVNTVATRILHLGAARTPGAATGQSLAEPSLAVASIDPDAVEQVGVGAAGGQQPAGKQAGQQPKKKPKPSQGRKKQNRPKSPSETRNR